MAKSSGRGGFRENAGRKAADPEGAVKTFAVSVPEGLMARLDALASKKDWNRSQAVTNAIRDLVGPPKRTKKAG
jgi:hypothetical protein